MRRTSIALASVLLLGACSSTTGGTPEGAAPSIHARISAFQYNPNPLELKVGDTVTWTNEDNIDHTVTSGRQREQGVPGVSEGKDARPDGEFRGGLSKKGATFTFTFDNAGEFAYFCEIHAGMTGTVIVK